MNDQVAAEESLEAVQLRRQPLAVRSLILAGLFALVALLDFFVDPDLSLFALYLLPTLYSVWFLGIRWGYGTCVASAIVWAIDDWSRAVLYHHPLIPFWNVVGRLVILAVIAGVVNALRSALEKEYEAERRWVQREFEIARDVQMHLLPSKMPGHARLEIGCIYQPAREVGGDYYDLIAIEPDRVCFAIGDVAGKGVSSALLMASLQALVRTHLTMAGGDIGRSVAELNTSLYNLTAANRFATLFIGMIDLSNDTLSYVNAGHNPPMLLGDGKPLSSGEAETLDVGGPPVGMFAKSEYRAGQLNLKSGEVLVAYTDGAVEALNSRQEEFGEERLRQSISEFRSAPAAVMGERIRERLQAFIEHQSQFDDITLVILKLKPAPSRADLPSHVTMGDGRPRGVSREVSGQPLEGAGG